MSHTSRYTLRYIIIMCVRILETLAVECTILHRTCVGKVAKNIRSIYTADATQAYLYTRYNKYAACARACERDPYITYLYIITLVRPRSARVLCGPNRARARRPAAWRRTRNGNRDKRNVCGEGWLCGLCWKMRECHIIL